MVAIEVRVNGKRVCVAGAADANCLGATVSVEGNLGPTTIPVADDKNGGALDIHYNVNGMSFRGAVDVYREWQRKAALRVGDVVEIRVVEAKKASRPRRQKRFKRDGAG